MPDLEDGEWEENEELTDDPANLDTPSNGPEGPHSVPPDTEPQPVIQDALSESDSPEEDEELPEFDPRHRQDFEGLMYIGKLTSTFEWLGHKFVIRTLSTDEILEVGIIHREYAGSLADVKAYQAAVVAACVESVDGKPLPLPLSSDPSDTSLINKFRFVNRSWFPPTLDVVYERYLLLEARVSQVIEAMGKASG